MKLKSSKRTLQTKIYEARMREETISRHDILSEIAEYTLSNTLISHGSAIVLTTAVCPDDDTLAIRQMWWKMNKRRDANRSYDSISSTEGSFGY